MSGPDHSPFLSYQRRNLADLGPHQVAGRGVRTSSGGDIPVGSPLPKPIIDQLAQARVQEIEVLEGTALRPEQVSSPTIQMRAALLRAIMWANTRVRPPEAWARDRDVGARAVDGLALAVAGATWFPPGAELISRYGLGPDFLGPSMDRALLSAITAVKLGWDDSVVAETALAAIFCRMGLLAIPSQMGSKLGALAVLERRQIERHPLVAAELLAPFKRPAPLVVRVALEQAERFDGRGYPSALSGSTIRPEAQVIAVVARYLAAVTDRPYRDQLPPHDAAELMMSESGRLAHPEIVKAFIDAVAPYPVGCMVRLSDGRTGVVNSSGSGARPVVEVRWDASGKTVDPVEVNLAERPTLFVTAVSGG